MIYVLADLAGFEGFANLFRYITFRAGAALLTALLIALIAGPRFIVRLRRMQAQAPCHAMAAEHDGVAVADFLPSGSGAFVAMQLALCRIPVRCDDNYQLLGAGQRPW